MINTDEILARYKQRVNFYGPLHSRMKMIQSIYNGTMEVPLPDMEKNAMPSAPNLLAAGVDQMAGRITSVVPSVNFASIKPGTRSYDRMAVAASRVITDAGPSPYCLRHVACGAALGWQEASPHLAGSSSAGDLPVY